ncbi:hypothetical protein FACS189451_07160 [Bacteroidia bacterium]|nr:hypothetical protein FACS189451_07160 [Bacteroidia bacterium]
MATIVLDYDARSVQAKRVKARNKIIYKQETILEKRKKLDKELDKYLINLSDFKFNRDEANDYE